MKRGIPIRTNCAPLTTIFFIIPIKVDKDKIVRSNCKVIEHVLPIHDDLADFNRKKFEDYAKEIYLSQLITEKANKSDDLANT